MAKHRDRDEESLIFFLKETTYGTEWMMREKALLNHGHDYKDLFNSPKLSQMEVAKNMVTVVRTSSSYQNGYL